LGRVGQVKRESWVQEKENFLLNSQSDLKEDQHYGWVKRLVLPSQNLTGEAACKGQTCKNCFGVLLKEERNAFCLVSPHFQIRPAYISS